MQLSGSHLERRGENVVGRERFDRDDRGLKCRERIQGPPYAAPGYAREISYNGYFALYL